MRTPSLYKSVQDQDICLKPAELVECTRKPPTAQSVLKPERVIFMRPQGPSVLVKNVKAKPSRPGYTLVLTVLVSGGVAAQTASCYMWTCCSNNARHELQNARLLMTPTA